MDDLHEIQFSTSADWWVSDLVSTLDSLDQLYNALALARHLGLQEREALNRRLSEAEENSFRFRKMGPELDMLFHEWARLLRRAGPEGVAFLPSFGWGAAVMPPTPLSEVERELAPYLEDPNSFLAPKNRLAISHIEMASPGGFSLRGLGEPLKQLRELIKDLCYRNRQEAEKGELELLYRGVYRDTHRAVRISVTLISFTCVINSSLSGVQHDACTT